MKIKKIKINRKTVLGIEIPLQNATLVIAITKKGYIMCGYLDISIAEKFGDCACIVRGVENINELISGKISDLTSKAKKFGIKKGMPVKEAILKII